VARDKYVFIIFLAVLLGIGFTLGVSVASHPKLEPFKLLNIVGLSYDLLGLIVLSEMVVTSDRCKRFVVSWGAGIILWGQTTIPLGAAVGAWFSSSISSSIAAGFFLTFWVYSLLPLGLLDAKVFYPRFAHDAGMDIRAKRMGLGLLLAGVFVQLVAAFYDLYA
jgi:hypothetical protein